MTYSRCWGSKGYGWKESHEAPEDAPDHLCEACRKVMHDAEAERPKEQRVWKLFAMKREERLEHFYPATTLMSVCGSGPVFLVQLRIDEQGTHWGWYSSYHPDNADRGGHVSMIYPHRTAVEMCFPYGPEAETKRGHGEIVRLSVEIVRPAVGREGIRYGERGREIDS